jgi:hypothetical protein
MTTELLELAQAQVQAALPSVSAQSLNKIYTACILGSEVE